MILINNILINNLYNNSIIHNMLNNSKHIYCNILSFLKYQEFYLHYYSMMYS